MKSKTKLRFEARQRARKRRIMKKIMPVILSIVLLGIIGCIAYGMWYNYIPTEVSADSGKIIYIKYRITEGDTLDGISKRLYKIYGYDRPCSFEWAVMKKNNIHNTNYIRKDDIIMLPKIVYDSEIIEIGEPN